MTARRDFEDLVTARSLAAPLFLPINARAIGEVTEISLLHVGFRFPNDLPHLFLTGILFDQRHGRPEFDGIPRKLRHVDDLGTCKLVL